MTKETQGELMIGALTLTRIVTDPVTDPFIITLSPTGQ
jgi:hypothetical protein